MTLCDRPEVIINDFVTCQTGQFFLDGHLLIEEMYRQGWIVARQTNLPKQRLARNEDPATSHAAARSVSESDLRQTQTLVLHALRRHGPSTRETLAAILATEMSPSGVRTRLTELVRAGFARPTGEKATMTTGRLAELVEAV